MIKCEMTVTRNVALYLAFPPSASGPSVECNTFDIWTVTNLLMIISNIIQTTI